MGYYLEASSIALAILVVFWAVAQSVDLFTDTFKESGSEEGKIKVMKI